VPNHLLQCFIPSLHPLNTHPPSRPSESEAEFHILIIGAGITGLTLAQALRKRNQENPTLKPIAWSIFERDNNVSHRGAGWGLTLHWALEKFLGCLPEDVKEKLPEAYVDKDSLAAGNFGKFTLYNMKTGEKDFETETGASPRHRFAREKLRGVLMHCLDIQVCITSTLCSKTTSRANQFLQSQVVQRAPINPIPQLKRSRRHLQRRHNRHR
jgi:hypothetical protein